MNQKVEREQAAVTSIVESLDVPQSAYERAIARYEAIAKHLERDGSALATAGPHIYAQGSFQIGTVVPPIDSSQGYDLDLTCELKELDKLGQTQRQLKELLGQEVRSYASKHGMKRPIEKPRCWHLDYRDDVSFHMDVVPAVPEDPQRKNEIAANLDPSVAHLANLAVGITDTRAEDYDTISTDWSMSNPMGYAEWFKGRMRGAATHILLEAKAVLREADEIPVYKWKTPLQIVVQILKRHRNVMFAGDTSGDAPISCIITTLAARAYEGQLNVRDALIGIVENMPKFIRSSSPRVANPVNGGEDFAEKWETHPGKEQAFLRWYRQLRRDLNGLSEIANVSDLREYLKQRFDINLREDRARELMPTAGVAATAAATTASTPRVKIEARPDPWRTSEG